MQQRTQSGSAALACQHFVEVLINSEANNACARGNAWSDGNGSLKAFTHVVAEAKVQPIGQVCWPAASCADWHWGVRGRTNHNAARLDKATDRGSFLRKLGGSLWAHIAPLGDI